MQEVKLKVDGSTAEVMLGGLARDQPGKILHRQSCTGDYFVYSLLFIVLIKNTMTSGNLSRVYFSLLFQRGGPW